MFYLLQEKNSSLNFGLFDLKMRENSIIIIHVEEALSEKNCVCKN